MGISLSVPEDKETLLHQWGRVAREGQKGKFFMLIPEKDAEQLEYISFQLGVKFAVGESPSLHPFEVDQSTADRLAAVHALLRNS